MQIIGLNLTKISAFRAENFKKSGISTNIEFTDIEKEKIDILKEGEAIKLSFKFSINYGEKEKEGKPPKQEDKLGEVSFNGSIAISVSKEESKDIQKSWKKKKLPPTMQMHLYNFILRRYASKALSLEDEINLPPHLPIPQVQIQKPKD